MNFNIKYILIWAIDKDFVFNLELAYLCCYNSYYNHHVINFYEI